MNKRIISQFSVLIVLTAFLASCSQQTEYVNVIPADASVVTSFRLNSLYNKADLGNRENQAIKQNILDALKNETDGDTYQQFEKIMRQPVKSGIDVNAPVYFFISSEFPNGAIVTKVNSKDDILTMLKTLEKLGSCESVDTKRGCSFTMIETSLIAFNETTAVIIPSCDASAKQEMIKGITSLMKQQPENSILQTGAFQEMEKQPSDICFLASMSAIPEPYDRQLLKGLPKELQEIDPDEIRVVGSLIFDKGKITLQMENYSENETVKESLEKQQNSFGKTNNTFVNYFPASALAFFNTNIKGEELYNLLLSEIDVNFCDQLEEIKTLFNAIDGDVTIGLTNITLKQTPVFTAYANVKDDILGNLLKELYQNRNSSGMNITKVGENDYIDKTGGESIFFGIKDKQLYVTNDKSGTRNIGVVAKNPVTEAPYAQEMNGKNMFLAINTEAFFNLPLIKLAIGLGSHEVKLYSTLGEKVSYLSLSTENGVSEITVSMKDKDDNALKQITDFIKQFAGL